MVLQNFEPFAPLTALASIVLAMFPQGGSDAGDPTVFPGVHGVRDRSLVRAEMAGGAR